MASKICVVIPAYNAAETIQNVVSKARKHVPLVMVADDCSVDGTARLAAEAGAEVITIDKNRGKGHALKRLFQRAIHHGCDAAISIDADDQHDPEEIPLFLEAHQTYPDDIILGSRMDEKEKIPRPRYNSMYIARFFISLAANQYIQDTQCGFRLYPLALLKGLPLTTDRYVTETEILIKAGDMGARIRSVKVKAIYGCQTSHFKTVMDVDAISAYVISYLIIKWWIESMHSDRPYTYSPNNIRDWIGKNKFLNARFQTLTALLIFPATVLYLVEYTIHKNNFASIRKLGCGFFKITLATHLLPILLVIATVERVGRLLGFKIRPTDRFIKRFYPQLWENNRAD